MKHTEFLAILLFECLLICFCSVSNIKNKSSQNKKAQPPKPIFEAYFFLQRLYPGVVALDNIKYSSYKSKLKYIILNEKFLYFTNGSKDHTEIQGGIKLKRILDNKNDITKEGKCCNNLKFLDHSPKIKLDPKKAPLSIKSDTLKPKKLNYKNANYCLELFAPFRARWRLCTAQSVDAYRLHLKIVFTLIKTSVNFKKVKAPQVIEKFFSNSKIGPEPIDPDWNWETQKEWKGKCRSQFMQSPVKIIKQELLYLQDFKFKLTQNLQSSYVLVEKRYNEIVVKFKNDPGLILLKYGSKTILYKPKYISFRFPGEHNIFGLRYSGDMLINCEELTSDKKKKTNGLIFTIPLEAKPEYANYKYFEGLSIDFWKYMVTKKGSYNPHDFITKRQLIFRLKDMMSQISKNKPTYYLYLGSQTTPPCEEYVYHLILSKPVQIANCQLKVLRENTLVSDEPRLIHSRLSQENYPNEYDDGITDDGFKDDPVSGGSIHGKEGDPHEDDKQGVLSLNVVPSKDDIYKYVEDKELRKRMMANRLDKVPSNEDPLNC